MKTQENKAPIDDCTHCGVCRDVCLAEGLGGHTITSLLSGEQCYSAWLCSCCWRCQEACPERVDVHAVMIGERRDQRLGERRADLAPQPYRRSLESVLRCGFAFPIGEEIASVRAAYGLPPLEPISAARLAVLLGSLPGVDLSDDPLDAGTGPCAEL